MLRLTGKDGKPGNPDQLQVEHPTVGDKPGEYRFDFSPRFGGRYHIWADIIPTATRQQEYERTLLTIKVTAPDGKEFTALEPVMGVFAHMVAFPEDLQSVTHVHPMGKEPTTAQERGGPELKFHVEPEKAGFHKFFLQTPIGGREDADVFVSDASGGKAIKPRQVPEMRDGSGCRNR